MAQLSPKSDSPKAHAYRLTEKLVTRLAARAGRRLWTISDYLLARRMFDHMYPRERVVVHVDGKEIGSYFADAGSWGVQ